MLITWVIIFIAIYSIVGIIVYQNYLSKRHGQYDFPQDSKDYVIGFSCGPAAIIGLLLFMIVKVFIDKSR